LDPYPKSTPPYDLIKPFTVLKHELCQRTRADPAPRESPVFLPHDESA
jgi:hypothetical protein